MACCSLLVNVLLLTVDYLRAESDLLLLESYHVFFAALEHRLNVNDHVHRNLSLVLSAVLLGIAVYRLLRTELTVFNIWIHC